METRLAWENNYGGNKTGYAKEKDEKSADEQKAPTWREFTQNTTFHGIRYVFDDTTWFRKLVFTIHIFASIVEILTICK